MSKPLRFLTEDAVFQIVMRMPTESLRQRPPPGSMASRLQSLWAIGVSLVI